VLPFFAATHEDLRQHLNERNCMYLRFKLDAPGIRNFQYLNVLRI